MLQKIHILLDQKVKSYSPSDDPVTIFRQALSPIAVDYCSTLRLGQASETVKHIRVAREIHPSYKDISPIPFPV
jgi:hypothetical protein